jgi:hypothetical protein
MPLPDSTLQAIYDKVRRLTRSPTENQLSTDTLNDYINTFVYYDFPEHLRLFDLRSTFTFYTYPNIDVYSTTTTNPYDPFYNFKQQYISVHEPTYIAGFPALFSQSREQFYGIYPKVNSIASIGVAGDGVTTTFSGTVNNANAPFPNITNTPILQNQVLFSSVDINNNPLAMYDVPISSLIGNLIAYDAEPNTIPDLNNFINYVTGEFTVTFPAAPAVGIAINSETVPYVAALPQALCFFNNEFILRPVPDQSYRVNVEVYRRPTALLESNQSPELEQWWQYIAYGAAKKIFEDRMDLDSVTLIMPEFKVQEALVLRKTIVTYTKERVGTIYSESTGLGSNAGGWGQGGSGGNF